MPKLYLIAEFAGEAVAIDCSYIESVVHVQNVVSVPRCDKSIAGIFALRSRVLTLVDSKYVVTGETSELGFKSLAVIMEIAGHSYGLLIERAYEVVSISDAQMIKNVAVAPQWLAIISCLAVVDGKTTMIIDPRTLVAGEELIAA
jgi:purine-binding chemotaxis protein CheW